MYDRMCVCVQARKIESVCLFVIERERPADRSRYMCCYMHMFYKFGGVCSKEREM